MGQRVLWSLFAMICPLFAMVSWPIVDTFGHDFIRISWPNFAVVRDQLSPWITDDPWSKMEQTMVKFGCNAWNTVDNPIIHRVPCVASKFDHGLFRF